MHLMSINERNQLIDSMRVNAAVFHRVCRCRDSVVNIMLRVYVSQLHTSAESDVIFVVFVSQSDAVILLLVMPATT